MSEELDNVEEPKELSIEEELRAAIQKPVKDAEEVIEPSEQPKEKPSESPENEPEKQQEDTAEEIEPAPVALSGSIKEKWKELPADVRAEWIKRENDIHQMFTRHDGELNMGRKVKDIVTPYMPLIQAANSTPEKTISDLMNTAYILATGSPTQKAQILQRVAQEYEVDLGLMAQQPKIDPNIYAMQQEINQLRQQANPDAIRNQLQEQMQYDSMLKEISTFAANPANKHFEKVKPFMGSLLESGQAKDLQEAYDMACYADPTIRSTLLAEQTAELEAKRKKELSAKKAAAVSVNGSPDRTSPQSRTKPLTLEDELRESLRAVQGVI